MARVAAWVVLDLAVVVETEMVEAGVVMVVRVMEAEMGV